MHVKLANIYFGNLKFTFGTYMPSSYHLSCVLSCILIHHIVLRYNSSKLSSPSQILRIYRPLIRRAHILALA